MVPQGETAELEEEVEEELEEEVETSSKSKKERKRFHEDNKYVFASEEEAVAHVEAGKIVYEDGSVVNKMRVLKMVKGQVTNEDGDITTEGSILDFVIARNKSIACEVWAEAKHSVVAELARPLRRGGGRGKSKIEANLLMFGKMLAKLVFNNGNPAGPKLSDVPQETLDGWALYEEGGDYGHYLTSERTWKEAT